MAVCFPHGGERLPTTHCRCQGLDPRPQADRPILPRVGQATKSLKNASGLSQNHGSGLTLGPEQWQWPKPFSSLAAILKRERQGDSVDVNFS